MAKVEPMVAVEAFSSNAIAVKRGMEFPSDHVVVRDHARFFVPASGGEEAMATRRREIERETEALRETQRQAKRAEAIRVGTNPLPSDDMQAEAAKLAVRNDNSLELVINDIGNVIGARKKR